MFFIVVVLYYKNLKYLFFILDFLFWVFFSLFYEVLFYVIIGCDVLCGGLLCCCNWGGDKYVI